MAIKNRLLQRSKNHSPVFTRRLLPLLVGTAISINHAQAIEFNLGEIEGRFDSQISIGASWRAEERNPELVSAVNQAGGGTKPSGSYGDGNLNFDKGDVFTNTLKGVHDLDLQYNNFGAFFRGKYWYDFELKDGDQPHGNIPNGYVPNTALSDEGFNDYAKFSGAEILDAYLYGAFDLGEKPLDVRLGRQVLNWGESTFIQGGLNSINPVDANSFRRAGAEIKEGLLPVNMAFASLGVTDNLSIEGFYQLEWEATAADACGTFFSNIDFAAQGCNGVRVPTIPLPGPVSTGDQNYFDTYSAFVVGRADEGRREADDDGQFGLAFRYFSEDLNNTEFGLYLAKYHSRLPTLNGVNATNALNPFSAKYYVAYPEDIKMLGLSFSTNIGDLAWSGEISHKQDVPVQMNGSMLVGAILRGGLDATNPASSLVSPGSGTDVQGYTLFDVTQLQTTFIKFYDQVLGASRLTLATELGWTHVHGLDESATSLKYGRNGAFGYTGGDNDGFVTQDSYGYVLRANLTYPDAFSGVNLTPQVSFKHGIEGYGPQPGAQFNEDEKTLSLTLTADYLNKYTVQAGYTSFFGGDYNSLEDRDFFSLSASVSF